MIVAQNDSRGVFAYRLTEYLGHTDQGRIDISLVNDDLADDKKETSNRLFTVVDYDIAPNHNLRFQAYQQHWILEACKDFFS